ncbi:MAG: hypothetical protein R3F07_19270 [Opitutaceae bacterium]
MVRHSLLLLCTLVSPFAWTSEGTGGSVDWPVYLGDAEGTHYSELKQINRENVDRLVEVWRWTGSGNREDGRTQIQCNPLIIDGILYGTTADLHVVAIDASTGLFLWRFDPFSGEGNPSGLGVNRGLSYWISDDGSDRRLFFSGHFFLHALDPANGRLIESFGEGGKVDLRKGLGRPSEDLFVISNTPGAVFGELIIMPVRVGEGPGPVPPGHIRAFNVRTGEQVWRFNTIPQPGEPGYETWPPEA